MNKLLTNSFFVSACALFCCALWGISTPIIKIGYQYIDADNIPSLLLWVGIQFAVGGFLTASLYSIVKGKVILLQKESILGIVKISLLQTVLQYTFYYIGLLNTTSVKGTILKGSETFFSILITCVFMRMEKLTFQKIFSCILGFAGLVVINMNGLELSFSFLGDGLVLLGVFSYCVSLVAVKKYSVFENPIIISGYQMLIGGAMLTVIGIIFGGKIDFKGILPVTLVLSLIFALSYALWNVLIQYNPISRLSLHSFTTAIFGVIFSIVFLHQESDSLALNIIISLIFISLSIIVWNYKPDVKIINSK